MSSNSPRIPAAASADVDDDDDSIINPNFLRNSWLMVMERKWWALTVFLLCILGAATYTFLTTPTYLGVATVQILKRSAQVLQGVEVVENNITSDVDFNTQIKVLESLAIIQSVTNRLTPEESKLLIAPFQRNSGPPPAPAAIIAQGRRIVPQRATLITSIQFRHPDAKMAARMANLIADEYINYNSRIRVEESLKAVDDLKVRADQQRERVDEIANALQAYRQRGNLVSLMQSKDIVTEKLKALNMMATESAATLHSAETRLQQVEAWAAAGKDMTELPVIAHSPKVSQLVLQITTQKLAISQLQDRYKSKHPKLINAVNGLLQMEIELQAAIENTVASVRAEYEQARQINQGAQDALAEQESHSLKMDQSAVEYESLNREFRVNEQLLESMMARMRAAAISSSIETESARIVDRAVEPGSPISPKIGLNLAFGAIGGLVLGGAFAFLLATIDDRVKTTFDVESLIELPLLGVIPRVERMDGPDKAQLAANGADPAVAESFLSLYSSLRVSEESRHAKLLLITSTLPGEGKSFVATNLAISFALQGLRTAIVDCDLRKPNVEQSFRLRSDHGIAEYCNEQIPLESLIHQNVHPNLDVLGVGSRVFNPIKLLTSQSFDSLVKELQQRYDRVIFDTPPIGAVSDALNIVELMDGIIYVIRSNHTKRTFAQSCIRRLRSTNVPIFGAALNDAITGGAHEYYFESSELFRAHYQSKAAT